MRKIMKLFIMQFSPFCFYFLFLGSTYSPQCSILKHTEFLSLGRKIKRTENNKETS